MVDRILHIGHRFSNAYNKELLQRAAEIYIHKGSAAVARFLVTVEKLDATEAETLSQQIDREMIRVNRSVLLQYAVALLFFMVLVGFGISSRSYIFAGLFLLPALRILFSLFKFLRRNKLH